jgi:long-subunit fatty acid transport protein
MKNLILTGILLTMCFATQAQDFVDNALLFSRTNSGGSARIQGIGGSAVSLGGDYSSAFSNPAGLGMFNRSEFAFSTGLRFANTSSSYFANETKDKKNSFNIPGLSLVFHTPSTKDEGFLGGSFAITLNRINDFNQNYTFSGINNQNSIVRSFVDDANGIYYDNEILDPESLAFGENNFYSLTGLAFNNFLIDTLRAGDGSLYYDSPLTVFWDENGETGSVKQTEISERRGAQSQWSIAYGANFSDKFFIGASVGITTLKFKLRQVYREEQFDFNADASIETPENTLLEIEENYNIEGNGVNFNLGMIYRPIDKLQIGAAFSTPTIYGLTDTYDASIRTNWNASGSTTYDYYGDGSMVLDEVNERFDVPIISEYSFQTPLRLTTGLTYISKSGFISGEIEFLNYAKSKYKSDEMDFSFDNQDIKSFYQSVVNYKVGGEYRMENWRFRGGLNLMSNPVKNSSIDYQTLTYSGGVGYRKKDYFVDLALLYSTSEGKRIPYFASDFTPSANQKFNAATVLITVGFPF